MLPNTDNIITQLVALGHTEGTVDDRLFAFLKTVIPDTAGGINDLLFLYLGQLGYVNTLPDRIKQWVDAGGILSAEFTPADLFAAGEKGGWYDVSDLSSMFQDAAGSTPVTATGQPVGRLEDKSGNGNHLTAAGTARPTLQQDGNGFYYLACDGVDDTLATSGNMAVSGGKVTLWTGCDKEGGFLTWIAQFTIGASQEGSFAQISYGGTFEASVKAGGVSTGAYATAGEGLLIATSKFDMVSNTTSEAANSMRLNGAAVTLSYNAQIPNGTFAAAPFFLGSQNGSFPFNGRIYSAIVRFAESTTDEIENTETWLNERMGAY